MNGIESTSPADERTACGNPPAGGPLARCMHLQGCGTGCAVELGFSRVPPWLVPQHTPHAAHHTSVRAWGRNAGETASSVSRRAGPTPCGKHQKVGGNTHARHRNSKATRRSRTRARRGRGLDPDFLTDTRGHARAIPGIPTRLAKGEPPSPREIHGFPAFPGQV